jgi:HEAT repeats
MVAIQRQTEYLKPDVAVKSPRTDWKAGVAGAALVAVTVTIGNMGTPTSPLASALMYQNVDNAKASGNGWVTREIERPSRAMFDDLAYSNPQRLIDMIRQYHLEPPLLTFAAESLGQITNSELRGEAVSVLLSLSEHSSSLVREGAVYGLASFVDKPLVTARLKEMLISDSSEGVCSAIEDVL